MLLTSSPFLNAIDIPYFIKGSGTLIKSLIPADAASTLHPVSESNQQREQKALIVVGTVVTNNIFLAITNLSHVETHNNETPVILTGASYQALFQGESCSTPVNLWPKIL